jgi:hypothetical protein
MPSSATGLTKMRTTFRRYHCVGDYQVAFGIVSDPVHLVDLGAVGFVYASDFTNHGPRRFGNQGHPDRHKNKE